MRTGLFGLLLLAAAAVPLAAAANPRQWSDDLRACLISANWETSTRACNAVIEAGTDAREHVTREHVTREHVTREHLARAHLIRAGRRIGPDDGTRVAVESDIDRAIADFTEAIRLDPTLGDAFARRARAWHDKKEFERAVADYDEAIRLTTNAGVRAQLETSRAAVIKERDAR
jgi:tetratricopeptide (TPR) repeat protein